MRYRLPGEYPQDREAAAELARLDMDFSSVMGSIGCDCRQLRRMWSKAVELLLRLDAERECEGR